MNPLMGSMTARSKSCALVPKWRNSSASETPASRAMSRVVAPAKPLAANSDRAASTSRFCTSLEPRRYSAGGRWRSVVGVMVDDPFPQAVGDFAHDLVPGRLPAGREEPVGEDGHGKDHGEGDGHRRRNLDAVEPPHGELELGRHVEPAEGGGQLRLVRKVDLMGLGG